MCLPAVAICNDTNPLTPRVRDTAAQPPRKVLVATMVHHFAGDLDKRLAEAVEFIDKAAERAKKDFPARRLDLVVLPETAIQRVNAGSASEISLPLDHEAVAAIAEKARAYDTYIALSMALSEGEKYSNAVVLLDRKGKVAGIYR